MVFFTTNVMLRKKAKICKRPFINTLAVRGKGLSSADMDFFLQKTSILKKILMCSHGQVFFLIVRIFCGPEWRGDDQFFEIL